MDIAAYFIVFTVGLLFGSFTNVIIARMLVGESIIFPPSHCPHCNERLRAWDLVPVLSYLFLRGRCRYCAARISSRYPLVEILCAMLFTGVYLRWGFNPETLVGWVFTVILLAAAFIDLDHGIIPDRLTYPGIVIGLVLSVLDPGIFTSPVGNPGFWRYDVFGSLYFQRRHGRRGY